MITRKIHMVLALAGLVLSVNAQVVDTSKSINTWKLMHNYSRFEDTSMDTAMFDLHFDYNPMYRNGIAYQHTGIIGNGAQNLYFFDRPPVRSFTFGKAVYPYMADPDRTVFYNTRNPFTEIVYSNIPGFQWGEETIKFLHTQNMDPYSNIGLDFEVLSGKQLFSNEDTRVTKFTIFGSRAKEKYSAFGTFHFNRFNLNENGGLQDADSFLEGTQTQWWLYPVNLSSASSGYTNMKFFYTQKFMITQKEYFTDTLGVTTDSGKNFSFNHQFVVERNSRYYEHSLSSYPTVPDFYDNFYYFNGNVKDSVVQDQISNTFQFILGDPYTDKLSARIYAGHELTRYGQRSPETYQVTDYLDTITYDPVTFGTKDTASAVFNNKYSNGLFVGFHMSGPPENKWYWNIDGKYYFAGYFMNNFTANATFSRQIFKTYRLGLRGNIENRNPDYYYNNYSSAFFRWENDFKASQLVRAEAFLTNSEKRFDAVASAGMLTNYLYWDESALPAQYDKIIYLLTGKLSARFSVSGFHSINNLILQYTTADEVLRLPLAVVKTSNYWEQSLFDGALIAQLGFDLLITSPYRGNSYMPVTGVFYLQNDQTIGGYPFLDVFLNFRIKRTRLFGAYCNGISLLDNNFFSAASYPTRPGHFRIGVAWTFYD